MNHFFWVVLIFSVSFRGLLQGSTPAITSPLPGAELRNEIIITGTTSMPNFSYAELSFAYTNDNTGTWFIIETTSQPIENGTLGSWDTTQISDGDYKLRLRVYLLDGSFQETAVNELKVRNNVIPITETPTSTPVPEISVTAPNLPTTIPVTVTPIFPTPIPLPANPASIDESQIIYYIQRGALATLIIFILFALTNRIRRN